MMSSQNVDSLYYKKNVVGTKKNHLFEHPYPKLELMGKNIFTIQRSKILLSKAVLLL